MMSVHRILLFAGIAFFAGIFLAQAASAAGLAAVDKFGVNEIYQTAGKEWFSNWGNNSARSFSGIDPQDAWFDAGHGNASYKVDGKGLLKISGSTPRMYIHDPSHLQGWTNVEMTVYAMRVSDNSTPWGGIEGVARTNHGTVGGPEMQNLCDTRGIDARIRYDGKTDFEKETSHPSSGVVNSKTLFSEGMPKNSWIGYKFVVYDLPNGNVKVESYMDLTDGKNGGNWQKINEFEDNGSNFGIGGTACSSGISPTLKLSALGGRQGSESAKPNATVYWRSDGVGTDGLVYKKMSVREIDPSGTIPQQDVLAPSIPQNLFAIAVSSTRVKLSWLASTDNVGVAGYNIFRNGTKIGTSGSAEFQNSGLSQNTFYSFKVLAFDAAGNQSVQSSQASAATFKASSASWQNSALSPVLSGQFSAAYTAIPNANSIDGLFGMSILAGSDYADFGVLVRFNTSGGIDARNGSNYSANSFIPYTAGKKYSFRLAVDVPARKYSVFVAPEGEAEKTVGTNFAFRTEQAGIQGIGNWGFIAKTGSMQLGIPVIK